MTRRPLSSHRHSSASFRPGRGRRLTLAAVLTVSTLGGVALVKVEGAGRIPAAIPASPHFACVAVANIVGICLGPPTAD